MDISPANVEEYYERTHQWMGTFWPVVSLHQGIYESGDETLREAVENTNRMVAELLHPKEGDSILDAGCGLGGTALFIAKKTRARVHGIANSPTQIKIAKRHAEKRGLADRVQFSYGDMTKTELPDRSFNHAYAVESMCHLSDRPAFLREMSRILKPQGRLVIADTFWPGEVPPTREDMDQYRELLDGWMVHHFSVPSIFAQELTHAGFRKIAFFDKEEEVKPFREKVARMARCVRPLTWLLSHIPSFPKQFHQIAKACGTQRLLADRGLIRYGLFRADKTEDVWQEYLVDK